MFNKKIQKKFKKYKRETNDNKIVPQEIWVPTFYSLKSLSQSSNQFT